MFVTKSRQNPRRAFNMPVLLGAAVLLSVLALGCDSKTTVLTSGSDKPGITVSGEGSAFGTPDVAVATLGVQSSASTVADARTRATDSMDAMLKALKDGGVADKDIQTTQFSVDPQYDYSNNKQTITGFMVNNMVTAKIHNIDKTGELIDAAVRAGGDQARVQSLQFTMDDPASLQGEARKKAMTDAHNRAQTLADAAGASVGAPRSITEGGGAMPITLSAADLSQRSAAGAPAVPIQTGQLEVKINVSVVYELK
jgi:uncharacterized protein